MNGTFLQQGFPVILELIPLCETVKKLSAICRVCGHEANFTFRTASECQDTGVPQIGGADDYMPLCRECLDFKKEVQTSKSLKVLQCESESRKKTSPLHEKDLNTKVKECETGEIKLRNQSLTE